LTADHIFGRTPDFHILCAFCRNEKIFSKNFDFVINFGRVCVGIYVNEVNRQGSSGSVPLFFYAFFARLLRWAAQKKTPGDRSRRFP